MKNRYGWITVQASGEFARCLAAAAQSFDSIVNAAADAMMQEAELDCIVAPVVIGSLTVSDLVSLEDVQEDLDTCREMGWPVTAVRLFDLVYARGRDLLNDYEHPYSEEGVAAFAALGADPTAEQIYAWLTEDVPDRSYYDLDLSKAVPVTLIEWREGEWVLCDNDTDPEDVAPAWLYWDSEGERWEWTALGKTGALRYNERRPAIAMQQAEAVLRAPLAATSKPVIASDTIARPLHDSPQSLNAQPKNGGER